MKKRSIFFNAIPGLFQRKKNISTENQPFSYTNKLVKSISKLQTANSEIMNQISYLNNSTYEVNEKTHKLFGVISSIKEKQATEVNRIIEQMNEINTIQTEEIRQVQNYLQNLEKKQHDQIGSQISEIKRNLYKMKNEQTINQVNMANEHEVLTLSLDRLFQRLDDLQREQEKEIDSMIHSIQETKEAILEKDDILIENDKRSNDLLYKLREYAVETDYQNKEVHANITSLLNELKQDVFKLQILMKENNEGIKN